MKWNCKYHVVLVPKFLGNLMVYEKCVDMKYKYRNRELRRFGYCIDKVDKNTGLEITVPEQVVRSSGIKPNFMCDTAAYLLGFSGAGDKADKKAAQKFEAAKELHLSLLSGVDSEAARTICNFFGIYAPESIAELELPEKVSEELMKELVTFTDEDSNYLMADPAIAAAWNRSREKDTDAVSGRCLVTGNTDEIAILHNKIKGMQGAQSSGANLIGFNARAYESYGKDNGQGLNAPVGKYAMYAYTSALNSLPDSRKSSPDESRRHDCGLVDARRRR